MPVFPRHYSFKRLETDRELRRRVQEAIRQAQRLGAMGDYTDASWVCGEERDKIAERYGLQRKIVEDAV